MVGRPSDYTPELANKICTRIADGLSIRQLCRADDMPDKSTVIRWLSEKSDFKAQYVLAKQMQAELMADEIAELSDQALDLALSSGDPKLAGALVQAQRLRVESRKWTAAKLLPKYADRQQVELTGELALADRIQRARAARDGGAS